MAGVVNLLELFRKVDRLLSLEEKHGQAIEALKRTLEEVRDRVAAMEAREQILVVEAKSAAREASSQAVQASLSDLSRRLGRLEATSEARPVPQASLPAPKRKRKKADQP